jgi:protein-disulfide isomerase
VRVDRARVPVVSPDAPSRGPATAPVTIQIFSDFECPFCAQAVPVLRALEADLGGSVRVVWRNFPLPGHAHARRAAAASVEVYLTRGGAAFWRFHDGLFGTQVETGLDDAAIDRLAQSEGVDPKHYAVAVTTGVHDTRIDADIEAGLTAGVDATPAFLVNDLLTIGVLPYDVMRAIVEQAKSEARGGS